MKKNFKFMLVALMAFFGFNGAMAQALEGTTQYANNGLQYKILSLDKTLGTYTVSVAQSDWNAKAADKTTLTIPATVSFSLTGEDHNGDAVNEAITFDVITIEANAFRGLSSITSVSLPSSITTIGNYAFVGTKIKTLDLSTTSITTLNPLFVEAGVSGENVDLNTVLLPATLVTLADAALQDCIQLSSVDFSLCTALTTLGAGSLSNTIVDTYDFSNCYTYAGGVYTSFLNFAVGVNPFVNATTTTNKNLETVILPYNEDEDESPVDKIGTVFANCEVLTAVTHLEVSEITVVADKAFEKDINLEALSFPATLTNVNGSPFDFCSKLASLTFDGSADVVIGNGAALYGADADALAALKTLKITVPATTPLTTTAATIAATALATNTGITTVEIATDGIFGGTIAANALKLAENENSTVTFGDVAATADFSSITGPLGVYTTELTLGDWADAPTLTAAPIVDATISKATVGEVAGDNILDAIGQAVEIEFTGEITAATLAVPANANAVLTTIDFNDIVIPSGAIVATTFDETNAPLLTDVTWTPDDADATDAFAQAAFGTASVGAAAKVTLHTTTAVGDGEYGLLEANLYNVIFDASAAPDVPVEIPVLGNASATYYYGKAEFAAAYTIDKETEDGEQVMVYSAFVDTKDNKIYMDPLSINNGQYIIAANQPVVIRMKSPSAPEDMTDADAGYTEGGKKAIVNAYAYTGAASPTMRYDNGGNIINDLKINAILFSSDYIGTNFVGKTLYAMKNPAKTGILDFGKVNKKSYLPAGSLYVETDEAIASARLEVVWLDGDQETAIKALEKVSENNGAIYNLQGIRVNAAKKGIYIQNGKKFVVK